VLILKVDMAAYMVLVADKDWDGIRFWVENKVDFHAVSLVKDAQVVHELKNYLQSNISINMFTQKRKFELHNNPAYLTQTKKKFPFGRLWCRYTCDCKNWKCRF
jgi:hypothetical protein